MTVAVPVTVKVTTGKALQEGGTGRMRNVVKVRL